MKPEGKSCYRHTPSIYLYKRFNYENTLGQVFFSGKIGFIMFSYFKQKFKNILVPEYFPKYSYLSTLQKNVLVLIHFGCTRTLVH